MLKRFLKFDIWTKSVVLYFWLGGLLGKGFAYFGLLFGAFLLLSPRVLWDRWYKALTRREDLLHLWAWALVMSLLYGIAEVFNGMRQGYSLVIALQILVFNLCPVYIFLGIWVAIRHPGITRAYIRYTAWFAVVYTPIYFLFLSKLNISLDGILPGSEMNILSNPGTGSPTLLGLLAYEPNLAKFWLPLLVLACLAIANQERADWLGLILALGLWGVFTKRIGRVFAIAGLTAAVLLIAALVDLKLPAIPGRGTELSARGTMARLAGAISPDLAAQVGGRADAQFYYGTVYWRQHWWAAIRSEVSRSPVTQMFGMGYGYPLAHLAGREVEKQGTRSPHNILYFAYAYSGFLGMALFIWLEASLFYVLWRVYKLTGQTYGFIFLAYHIVQALFGNTIETPQGGISIYLLVGMTIAPAITQLREQAEHDREEMLLFEASAHSPQAPEWEHARTV
jgi:hypothetical protein